MEVQALPVQFEALKDDRAFQMLMAKAREWIAQEEDLFFKMPEDTEEEQRKARAQKRKIKNYEELLGRMESFVRATIAQKTNPKYNRR